LGKLTYEVLEREVGDWHRFDNRRQVASYTGMCPREDSSAQRRFQGSINKHGNPRVRTVLVEASWRLVQYASCNETVDGFRCHRSKCFPPGRSKIDGTTLPVFSDAAAIHGQSEKLVVLIERSELIWSWR
jgi:hypothetical protein